MVREVATLGSREAQGSWYNNVTSATLPNIISAVIRERLAAKAHYFQMLTTDEQAAAVKRMASEGWSDHGIDAVTRLSVEAVRRIICEPTTVQS